MAATNIKADVKAEKKADTVKIRLPKENRGEENFVIVSVNCKNYKIMKGVEVEVPVAVAEVLEHSEQAMDEANSYMDKKAEK
jgi:hypothetical protein